MEINYYTEEDQTWCMGGANVSGDDIQFYIEHKDGVDFDIWMKLADIAAGNKVFNLSGPTQYYAQIEEYFSREDNWNYWIVRVARLAENSDEIGKTEELCRKATAWDQLQQEQLSSFIIPSIDEVMERAETGTTTIMDEFVCEFDSVGGQDLMRRYTAFVLSWAQKPDQN